MFRWGNRSFSLHGEQKTTFNSQQPKFLLNVLTRQDLNCKDFWPKYDNTKTSFFSVLMI